MLRKTLLMHNCFIALTFNKVILVLLLKKHAASREISVVIRIEWKFLAHKFCTLSIHVLQNLFWWVPRYGLLIDIANTSSQLHTTVFCPGACKILLRYIHIAYDMIYQL